MANNTIIGTAFSLRVGSLPESLGNPDVPEIPRWLLFHPVPTLSQTQLLPHPQSLTLHCVLE